MDKTMLELSKPFPVKYITWKPGATTKARDKALAMPYADVRAYQKRLDEVCGLNWSVTFKPWEGGRIICELTINSVTRSSTGESEGGGNAGTSAEAQAFKRAGAMFGLGRYLYDLPKVWVEYDAQRKRVTDGGEADLRKRYTTWYERKMAALQSTGADEDEE